MFKLFLRIFIGFGFEIMFWIEWFFVLDLLLILYVVEKSKLFFVLFLVLLVWYCVLFVLFLIIVVWYGKFCVLFFL